MKISSLAGLPDVAAQIVELLADRPVVAFHGPMGAGKTTLIRAIAQRLGVVDEVTSPTFAIVNQYVTAAGETVYHFDFYRIESLAEAMDIGLDEYLDSGAVCLMEWPEKVAPLLPSDVLNIDIRLDRDNPEGREVVF